MRLKKPVQASIVQVRITREGTTAVIDHADPTISGGNLTIGDAIHGMACRIRRSMLSTTT